jgi:hypothetical protein
MKKIVILAALFMAAFCVNAQTVKVDKNGNYVAVKVSYDSAGTGAKKTGKTYTDSKGNVYPVMISKNGKLFVIRISKAGNKYNQYLKL